MRIEFRVGIYQRRRDGEEQWTALTPDGMAAYVSGQGEVKLRERMVDRLREVLRKARTDQQDLFQLPLGTELVRISVDVKLENGKLHGLVPFIVEPRWTGDDRQTYVVYHPIYRQHWFAVAQRDDIEPMIPTFLRHHFGDAHEDDLEELGSDGKDRLTTVAFAAEPYSLLDILPSRKKDTRTAASARSTDRVLADLGIDETRHASGDAVRLGVPRSPYRERLSYLLGGARPRSTAVVGPPGSGKTMLIRQWIADRLAEDGFPIHKNLDRVHHVWRLSGKRVIAGMSYLGQWEERCLSILDEARTHAGILWVEDLHLFGRLGQSRQSERSFADFFRGPVRRGDLAIVAEMTHEQFARLERDAPGLAEALAQVVVPAASPAETAQLLLSELRELETEVEVDTHPFVPRTTLELGSALFPWRARPGVAIELLRRVVESAPTDELVMPQHVLAYLARTTGLSAKLLSLDEALEPDEIEAAFAARVIGQPAATKAATDVVLRMRSGLADPHRPINVMLFTGPTGTGKTELATAIAEYLYGSTDRLVRIDMGELSGTDAVARLIGDRWSPEGLLTSRVRAQPFCVVLLDEIEKAHSQALHLLLQLFDEGRLTDANGEVASFASAVVIMTSNLGSRNAAPIGFGETRDRVLADVAKAVREFFPVELFNRIDQVVPFEPLTPEVAAKVVDKELAKLLARRGLRERNTFVYAGAAVRKRAVSDAFDPRYGARTVKRWLEDRVGGALTDLLATAPPARLRIVRLAENDGELAATLEPLREREPAPGPYVLEGALDLATSALEPVIAVAVAAIDRVRTSPAIARAKETASSEVRYYVDELEQRLAALAELFGMREIVHLPDPADRDEDEPMYRERIQAQSHGDGRLIRVRMRSNPHAHKRPPAARDTLIAGVAEALLVERALPRLLDPDEHAVTVVLSRVGATADAAGLLVATQTIAQPAWVDGAASHDRDGIDDLSPFDIAWGTQPLSGADVHRKPRLVVARDAAVQLRGLFVRTALESEHGTWMVRAAASEPDVIRVEVRPGVHGSVKDVLRAHLAARQELERVLEHGGELPPNPDALLPVTRTITFRAPLRPGESYHVELEDFATGWVDRGNHRALAPAIRRAWYLAWSRSDRKDVPR